MEKEGMLKGIRVLDFGRYISAPYCSMMLADMGADVIKVEKLGGEDTREIGPFKNGETLYFPNFNRNKRGVSLDFRAPDAKKIFDELVRNSDVLIENFRPGTLEKMGMSDEHLKEINPRIVVAHISGYGQSGQLRDRGAFDWIVQAMGGIMSLTGTQESGPILAGLPMCDHLASVYSAYSIMMALYNREKTGKGKIIDIALLDCVVSILQTYVPDCDQNGVISALTGHKDPLVSPVSRFTTKNGYVYIHAGTQALYKKVAAVVGGILLDEPYQDLAYRVEHRDIVEGEVEKWTLQRTSEEVEAICVENGIPCGIVNSIKQVVESTHLQERGAIVDVEVEGVGPVKYPGTAVKFMDTPKPVYNRAPRIGEHNQDVLREIGFSAEEIASFKEKNVIV